MSKKSRPVSTDRKLPPVEIFYDARDGGYWWKLNGRFIAPKKSEAVNYLKTLGYDENVFVDYNLGRLRETEAPFQDAMHKRMIDYAGSLAGHRAGIFTDAAGRSMLVTDEAKGVWDELPKKIKEPEFFAEFIQELLPGEQAQRLCYWLAQALHSLRRGDFRPGQVVVLAGPPRCGKSLLQSFITDILGGRTCNPFRYLMGETQFNKDLISAEHWMIEDPPSTTDIRTRRAFGNNLKNGAFTVNFAVHAKGKDAMNLPLFRRITISINDEPENLAVIPPLEGSINDKLILLKCERVSQAFKRFYGDAHGTTNLPMDFDVSRMEGQLDRKLIQAKFQEELTMIRAWLLKAHLNVPASLRDERCGVTYFHHPDLEAELCNLSPEYRLLQVIDHVYFSEEAPHSKVEKMAFDIERELMEKGGMHLGSLTRHPQWCGTYLARLMLAGNKRISKRKVNGKPFWTIQPPPVQQREEN